MSKPSEVHSTVDDGERKDRGSGPEAPQDTSSQTAHTSNQRSDDDQWAIVQNTTNSSGEDSRGNSTHFDITIGWGRWKHTIFSYNRKTG
ncbi:hypothetical protein F4782DRAFT_487659 [Xylaria castorea]|nr:hypothetical protein F4782DRAFT_487659 [Xylaria castorea]